GAHLIGVPLDGGIHGVAHVPPGIEEEGTGEGEHTPAGGHRAVGVHEDGEVHLHLVHEGEDVIRVLLEIDGHDGELILVVVGGQTVHGRNLVDAGGTPCGPEVHQRDPPETVLEGVPPATG